MRTWHVEIETEYGDLIKHSVSESSVPKKIKDRSYSGEFGKWLEKKYHVTQSPEAHIKTRLLQFYPEEKHSKKKLREMA